MNEEPTTKELKEFEKWVQKYHKKLRVNDHSSYRLYSRILIYPLWLSNRKMEAQIADLTTQRNKAWEILTRLKELRDKGNDSLTTHYSLCNKIETMFYEAQKEKPWTKKSKN